jgi:hypothetical protein
VLVGGAGEVEAGGAAADGLFFELGLRPGASPLARYRSGDIAVPETLEPLPLQERQSLQLRERPGAPAHASQGDLPGLKAVRQRRP